MTKSGLNVSLKGADDIFSTEESRQEQRWEQVQQIPIAELHPFTNHPFKVLDDESMQRTVESVEQYGVLYPIPYLTRLQEWDIQTKQTTRPSVTDSHCI